MSTSIYAERISEAEFNVNYKNYKNELASDQAALKKLSSESSFEATVKSNLLTCKVWDSKLAIDFFHKSFFTQLQVINSSN